MSTISSTGSEWEHYWSSTKELMARSSDEATSIWEASPSEAVHRDIELLKPFLNEALPFVDLGCGSGAYTQALAQYVDNVVGVDISSSAIELATQQNRNSKARYVTLDVFNVDAVDRLNLELGDANVYIRALIHLAEEKHRAALAKSVKRLLGARGTLFVHEMSPAAQEYFSTWTQKHGLPVNLRRVIQAGIKPGIVDRNVLMSMFSPEHFEVLAEGDRFAEPLQVYVSTDEGTKLIEQPWAPPSYFMILRPRRV